MDQRPLLRIEKLSVGFEGTTILRGISFDVTHRGILGVLGPAGVGKSTLLRTLGRWNEARPGFWVDGRVVLDNRDLLHDVPLDEARRRVALLAQKARLFTSSILDNAIAVARGSEPLTLAEKHALAQRVLERWNLWAELKDHLAAPAVSLSIARQRMLSLARLCGGNPDCLLVDEPLRDVAEKETPDLRALLERLAESLAVVVVTHNQRLARDLCDHVTLITNGRLVERGPSQQFFSRPETRLGQSYVRHGNCWPIGEELEGLPSSKEARQLSVDSTTRSRFGPATAASGKIAPPQGFHWIIVGLLGGTQWPGLLGDESSDLDGLVRLGARVLVSLTERPFDPDKLSRRGIEALHFPIDDMSVPSLARAVALCRQLSARIDARVTTVVHCKAGLGRTGTILACVLVERGADPVRAVHEVRQINPRYIQSPVQLAFVPKFAAYLSAEKEPPRRDNARR